MRIFVSYSHLDTAVADKLSAALKAAGFELWKWNETLRPGDNIAKKTLEGIERADAFLLLVSANSLASKAVLNEFSTLALSEISKRDLQIIPIVIDSTSIPGYLSQYLYIDISQDIEAGISHVVASLKGLDVRDSAVAAVPAPGPSTTHLAQLTKALQTGRLTLICGAGISAAADIPYVGRSSIGATGFDD